MAGISFDSFRHRLNFDRLLAQALQQASGAGKSQPGEHPVDQMTSNKECCRSRDPEAEALETVHQTAGQPISQTGAKANNKVRRAVFLSEQVSHAPGGERGQNEPDPEFWFKH